LVGRAYFPSPPILRDRAEPLWGTTFWVDPKDQLVAVMMMQSAPVQARYYRSLIRNLVSQALID
jgi:CubicO group peptidase (beta-lactamase class C family)